MSIFSDYAVGAMTDEEYRDECIRMNLQDRYEREHEFDECEYEEDEDYDV